MMFLKGGSPVKNSSERVDKWMLFGIALLSRLVFIPFAQSVDADATTRLFTAYGLIDSPAFITEGIWLPFHYYFVAIFSYLFNGSFGALLSNILIASLIVFPLYDFTAREFSKKGAFLTVLFFVFLPVFFRNSFLTLSGVPNAFFIALTFNYIALSIRENSIKYAVLAGLSMTIASGFRYESWLLFGLLTGVFLLSKRIKLTSVFWLVGMIFPFTWMVGNYIAHEDIFYGLSGAYHWNIELSGVNDYLDFTIKFMRGIFFPLSLFLQITPVIFVGLVIVVWKRKLKLTTKQLIWLIPFAVFSITFIFKAVSGTLFLQHRFTISLFLLFVPVLAIPFGEIKKRKVFLLTAFFIPITLVFSSLFILKIPFEKLFSFSYTLNTSLKDIRYSSMYQFPFIPRLSDQEVVKQLQAIQNYTDTKSGLILDFDSWESTYFLARNSGLKPSQIHIVDGVKHGEILENRIVQLLENSSEGIILIRCFSKFSNLVEVRDNQLYLKSDPSRKVFIKRVYQKEATSIFLFSENDFGLKEPVQLKCPGKGTLNYYKIMIKQDQRWYEDVKQKAVERNISNEEMLEIDAKWMMENKAI